MTWLCRLAAWGGAERGNRGTGAEGEGELVTA